jgi:Zn-dependent peptidase ImmA (M78 family)
MSRIPYATNDALDDYAERVVGDFAPGLLKTPGPLDVDEFLEYYLGLTVKFYRLSYNRKILGVTAFNDGLVDFINDGGIPDQLHVEAGTVIIDTSLTADKDEHRMRFTMMHEGGGHWLLHRKAFADDNPCGPAGVYANQYIAAKDGRGDYTRSQKQRNDIERMERQADFTAAGILMPRCTLREVFREFFRFYGEKPRRIIRGINSMDDCFAKLLPKYVGKVYNVSQKAAEIRLEKLTAIVNKGWRKGK